MRKPSAAKSAKKKAIRQGLGPVKRRRRAPKKTSQIDALAPILGPKESETLPEEASEGRAQAGNSRKKTGQPVLAAAIIELIEEKAERIKGPLAEKILKLLLAL